ncbi:MAG: SURF1 family protein [Alphaproteobacteria bacterium]|nr:SURF1 family protein [Alphaproteobacteria bacterium]
MPPGMFRLKPALWPTLFTLPTLVLALGLGFWQLERREWKRDILDRIATNQAAPVMPFADLLAADPQRHEYGKVRLAGTFMHEREFHLAARNHRNKVGLQIVTPVRLDDGRIVLFNRGWVPSERKDPARRAEGQLAGRQELSGVVRRTQTGRWMAPENAPDKNVWFHVDVPAIRALAGASPDARLDRFFIEADDRANPGGIPIGGQTRLDIPNDHLQYAITWFLVALSLIGVYLAFHWQNGWLTVAGRRRPDGA